jgi:CRP/FNR family transcriptional regulator
LTAVKAAPVGTRHHGVAMKRDLIRLYPALRGVYPPAAGVPEPQLLEVAAGTVLFSEHDPCKGFPLLLQGEVRVSRSSGDGRCVELYRVVPGELCLVSSACLFRAQPMAAHAVATRPTSLLMVTAPVFHAWMADATFREYVLGVFAQRMADLTTLVDALAFQKLDRRLASALLGHGPEIATTHQDLADALGTVREIITRVLHRFEQHGWVQLSRERIRIVDGAALRRCAAGL